MVLGSWNPKSTICPFRARKWPFQAPKTLRFKGKMVNFEAKHIVKQGEKRQKDKWYPFHACTPPGLIQHVLTVLVGAALGLGASETFPGLAFCFMGPWTFAWICCPQFPYRPCKNRTHSTYFYSTGGTRHWPKDIPPKSLVSLGFQGHTKLFGPQPLHGEDPRPTGRYPDPKVWVCAPFSCLVLHHVPQAKSEHVFFLLGWYERSILRTFSCNSERIWRPRRLFPNSSPCAFLQKLVGIDMFWRESCGKVGGNFVGFCREFPNLVVSNLVVCNFYALLRPFADLRLRSFALICAHLRASRLVWVLRRPPMFRMTVFGNSRCADPQNQGLNMSEHFS